MPHMMDPAPYTPVDQIDPVTTQDALDQILDYLDVQRPHYGSAEMMEDRVERLEIALLLLSQRLYQHGLLQR